jgi:DNA-binding winged helix-turn-helix (wHTH) protein
LLATRAGELVTRDEIHRELWKDGEFVEFEHAVNTAIRKIRIALDDDTGSPRIIETLPRKGYRFIATVVTPVKAEVVEAASNPYAETTNSASRPVHGDDFVLPVSATSSRILFLLAQTPYIASYLAVFYAWNELDAALLRTFGFVPVDWSRMALQVLALVGFAVRIYLIGLVGWDHTDAGPRYRKLFPFLLPLDAVWAATPLLVEHKTTGPLVAWSGLILMGWLIFGQRTLMKRIESRS